MLRRLEAERGDRSGAILKEFSGCLRVFSSSLSWRSELLLLAALQSSLGGKFNSVEASRETCQAGRQAGRQASRLVVNAFRG